MFGRRARAQEAVLGLLSLGEMSGRDLRDVLRQHGIQKGPPSFYSMMAGLEDSGDVIGWWAMKEVAGVGLRERRYRLPGTPCSES